MAVTVNKMGKVIVGMLDAELRAAGVDMSDPASSVAYSSLLQQVTVNAPAATAPQLALIPGVVASHTGATPISDYAAAFNEQRRVIVKAFYTFSEGFRTASVPPTLAQYRTILGSTLSVVNTLPITFTTELSQERSGLALADPTITLPSSWTLTQCQGWHTLLSGWLGRALAAVSTSSQRID